MKQELTQCACFWQMVTHFRSLTYCCCLITESGILPEDKITSDIFVRTERKLTGVLSIYMAMKKMKRRYRIYCTETLNICFLKWTTVLWYKILYIFWDKK